MTTTLNLNVVEKTHFFGESNGSKNTTQNLSDYEVLATKGDAVAQFKLGELYQNGRHVTHDFALSIRWYKKAAEQGHVEAQYNLGVIYKKGRGVPIDFAEAFQWYKKAAEQDMPQAQNNLAGLYFYGLGVAIDLDQALFWYKKAAGNETAKAQYNLGIIYQHGLGGIEPDTNESLRWHQKAAQKGYTESIKEVRVLTNQNPQAVVAKPAVKLDADNTIEHADATEFWLKEIVAQVAKTYDLEEEIIIQEVEIAMDTAVAKQTNAPVNEIAVVDKPYTQELVTEGTWFLESAEKGDAEAQYNLAVIYEYGLLLKQDYMESIFWYKESANQGYPEAQNQLGAMYQEGIAVTKNLVESYVWFALAKQSSKFSDIDLVAIEKNMTGEELNQAKLKVAKLSQLSMG